MKISVLITLVTLLFCTPVYSGGILKPGGGAKKTVSYGVGVPSTFKGMTASGGQNKIVKGNLNNLRSRPQIINEHTESSRSIIATIDSTTIVGQIFKASQDNINGLNITLLGEPTFIVDDFNSDSYANNSALQAAWVADDELATIETTIVDEGDQSMKLDVGDASSNTDEWVWTVPASGTVDLTSYTGSLRIYQNKEYKDVQMSFFVGDGTNKSYAPIVYSGKEVWNRVEIAADQLVGSANITLITKVGIRLDKKKKNGLVYIDVMEASPEPGAINLKLFDMGSTLPVAEVAKLSEATQYIKLGDYGITGQQLANIELEVVGGKRQYHIDEFIAGVSLEMGSANEVLTEGNYYAITLNYVDTDVDVYGPNEALQTGGYYTNGYSFTTSAESTAITATGADQDLQFCIFSTQDVYLINLLQLFDDVPGDASRVLANVEQADMGIFNSVIVQGIKGIQTVDQSFLERPYFMEKGGKFEFNYNDDKSDSVTLVDLFWQYLFKPEAPNG